MGAPEVSLCIRLEDHHSQGQGKASRPERTADQKPRQRLWLETHTQVGHSSDPAWSSRLACRFHGLIAVQAG